MANQVTLFSNGIGHFRREYKVGPGVSQKLSIPFKRDHVGDVLASLSVFGNVKYDTPPSFTPVNSNATSLVLKSDNALRSLITSLSGAEVRVEFGGKYTKGIVLGIESDESKFDNSVIKTDYIVLNTDVGVKKVVLSLITNLEFTEESVRSEINKALKNSFQKIKPDSTFLDLALSAVGEKEESAVVQYTVPVAAWKMRYNIRLDNGRAILEGTAIIDNNTDEDWDNFVISVVTGNPISFSTDLAQVKVPNRSHINLVDTQVHGNVAVSEGAGLESYSSPTNIMRMAKGATRAMAGPQAYLTCASGFGMAAEAAVESELELVAASTPGVDAKDVGDFCVFTNKEPITIQSKRSAVVPMFQVPLSKAGSVLIYKEADHSHRPWRAVRFKNETAYSLGRGKVVVYQDGVFSGECVLEAAKPGDNRMLPHCLENGVKVIKSTKSGESKVVVVKLTKGMIYQENVQKAVTNYELTNKTANEAKFIVEHQGSYGDNSQYSSQGVEIEEVEKILNGVRLYLTLPANGKIKLEVTETNIQEQKFSFGHDWLNRNYISVKHPITTIAEFEPILNAQKEVDDAVEVLSNHQDRHDELSTQADRIRKNLEATKSDKTSNIRNQWIEDLDSSEKEIRSLDKEMVKDNSNIRVLNMNLEKILKDAVIAWQA